MRYANIHRLLEQNAAAKEYFMSLSPTAQDTLLAHGNGVNTLEELKRFSEVCAEKSGKKYP